MFGLPGDGINGIMEALRRHADKVRFVLVHHEEAAAFMASGYAKATGKIGVRVDRIVALVAHDDQHSALAVGDLA